MESLRVESIGLDTDARISMAGVYGQTLLTLKPP